MKWLRGLTEKEKQKINKMIEKYQVKEGVSLWRKIKL